VILPFAENEQAFPPDDTQLQKRPYGIQDDKRSRSDEEPEYLPVSMSCHDDAHQHKHKHESGNSQVSISFA